MLRFAIVGGICSVLQLVVLGGLLHRGMAALPANSVAFAVSAQFNFYLSDRFTWADRRGSRAISSGSRRWLVFHGAVAGTFLCNQLMFVSLRLILPTLIAAALAIAGAATATFAALDRLTFREGAGSPRGCSTASKPPDR